MPSLLVTALHPPYTQNLWDLLKFILTINVLFHFLPSISTSNCSFKSFFFLYVKVSLKMMVSITEIHCFFTLNLQPIISTFTIIIIHPLHTKRAFPFSLALKIWRICSFNETHNLGLLKQEIQRVRHTIAHAHDLPTRIPLVV